MNNAGKGDKQRPTDQQKYAANYDKIFGTKTHRHTVAPTEPVVDKKSAKKQ
jgi:hypothetical protein